MQKKISTIRRFILPVLILLVAVPFVLTGQQTKQQLANTQALAREQALALAHLLRATDVLVGERADNAMQLLIERCHLMGAPVVAGTVDVNGVELPNLKMGNVQIANNSDPVDYVSAMMGGTATLFVKADDNFIRVSTNVKQENDLRAIGTMLDPNGKVIAALREGQNFSGVVDILGEPYITRYEPIFDSVGYVIGAYYVGFKVDMKVVRDSIEGIRQLETGFAAVLDANNKIRFLSSHISHSEAEKLLHSKPLTWKFVQEDIPDWGFKLIVAYSVSEARAAGLVSSWIIIVVGAMLAALLMVTILWQLQRLILTPLGADPAMAIDVVKRITAGDLNNDGLEAKPDTLMSNVLEMRQKLRDTVETLRSNAERMSLSASVFNHAHDGIFITDAKARIIEINPAFTKVTGYVREAALGRTPQALGFAIYDSRFFEELLQVTDHDEAGEWRGETWNKRANGDVYAAWLDMFTVRNHERQIINYVGLFSDITDAKAQQQNLERMAYHDPLTQLPNRVLLSDRLQQALARAQRSGELLAVCCLDLDGFKPVNDTLGHDAGDQLLVQLAARMTDCLRESDTVGRLGGDEFAVLLCGLRSIDECKVALERLLDTIKTPYNLNGETVSVSSSIGYTVFPADDSEPDTLLRHADHAMYQAKLNGGSRIHQFDADYDRQFRGLRQDRERIEAALPKNEFCLYYQPKVDMQHGVVVGMEALIRWQHPELGLRPPAAFLPIIEDTDFSITLGEWVIREALGQISRWRNAGFDLPVSINISAKHIIQHDFTERLTLFLAEFPDVEPSRLEFEITETAAIEDIGCVVSTINSCKALGVTFALDDFGVGYSSLTYLRRLPVATIKVDQSFVRDMLHDVDDLAMVACVISLGRDFRCKVVAEGVETPEHGLELLRMGCTIAQGYGIARPMPAADVTAWIEAYQPNASWAQAL